jgi:anti-sigma B factor antagonist
MRAVDIWCVRSPGGRMPPNLNITVNDDGQTLVVTPSGEIDMFTSSELAAALDRRANGHRAIVCDLSRVTFLDSTGLRLLLTVGREEPERFAIANPSEPVERLLELTGMVEHFRRAR